MKQHILFICLIISTLANAQMQIGQTIVGSISDGTGTNVSISGDGTRMVFGSRIGHFSDEDFRGFVRVYEIESGQWAQLGQTLFGESDFEFFGSEVEMSTDGNIISAGGRFGVRSYKLEGDSWIQIGSLLTVPDISVVGDVKLSGNGEILAVFYYQDSGSPDPDIRVYRRDNDEWVEMGGRYLC